MAGEETGRLTGPVGGPVRLIDSPIRYMQARAAFGPPRLYSALLPVAINALVLGGISFVTQSRIRVLMPDILEPLSLPGLPIPVAVLVALIGGFASFAFHAGVLIIFDMLTTQSRQASRFVELCALAYWPQLLYSIPALAATLWFFDPPLMVYRGAGADVVAAGMNYAEELARLPFVILMDQTRQFALIWLIGLHACTLRVVSGLSVGATWMAAIALVFLFIGVPLAIARVVQELFF